MNIRSKSPQEITMNRRPFLGLMGGVVLGLGGRNALQVRPQARGTGIDGLYEGLDSGSFFEDEVTVEVQVPDPDFFTEGPAVAPDQSVYFSNVPASFVYRWVPGSGTLSRILEDTGKANGLAFDREGRLLVCEQDRGRVTRFDLSGSDSEIVADSFEGQTLEAPNDLVVDRQGAIYFTSRPTSDVPTRGSINAVYRVQPDGTLERLLQEPQIQMPNGIALSPDQGTLYVVEAHPDEGRNRHIRAWEILAGGRLGPERVLIDFYPGRSGDGMCVDREGNLYVAAGLHQTRGTSETLDTRPGIHVISPAGKLLAYLRTPFDTVSNCTFGGPERRILYITCGRYLLSVRTVIPGPE